jgi:cyclophilin family peptidyl-prolyl cis-trans isomerase
MASQRRFEGSVSGNQKQREQRERAVPASVGEPNSPRSLATAFLTIGGSMAATLLIIVVVLSGSLDNLFTPEPTSPPPTFTPIPGLTAPAATPLASPPAEPAGDGTQAVIETEFGDIVIELYNQSAPVAAQNFINLAEAGYYDGVIFHRIIPDFVIQGGDPQGTGQGGPGFTILDEPVVGDYGRGIVAMARVPGVPNSQGSQFFIVLSDEAIPALDSAGNYVIFGNVVEGMDVVDDIAAVETGEGDRPIEPVTMLSVTIESIR